MVVRTLKEDELVLVENLNDILEKLVDAHGIRKVAFELGVVCNEKSEHIKVNWQDENLSRDWDHIAEQFILLDDYIKNIGM